jgi:radical SAM protein with 4Fe4S-binding SPASM domain
MVISKFNQQEILNLIDLAADLQVSQVILSNLLPATVEDKDMILYTRYENEEMHKLFKKVRNYSLRRGLEVKLPAYQLKTERRCRFIEDDATMITAEGDVVPCYRFVHDGTEIVYGRPKVIKAHSFGNINNETLTTIYDSAPYKNYRTTVLNNHYPSCIDCDLVDGCDMVRDASADCYGNTPSCADCLWSRNIIYCV